MRLPARMIDPGGLADGRYDLTVTGGVVTITPFVTGVTIQDENGNIATDVKQIDFQGAGVAATPGTGEVVVTVPGASGGGGGGSPARVLLKEIILTAPQATVSFAGVDIPASGYRSLEVDHIARSDSTSGTNVAFNMAINGDTADANYVRELVYGNGASAIADVKAGVAGSRQLGGIPGATAPAGAFGTGRLRILDYTNTGFHKIVDAQLNSLGAQVIYAYSVIRRANTAAVTSLDFTTTGNFDTGTVFRLYGLVDALGAPTAFRGAKAVAASQSIASGASTALTMATEEYDTSGIHDTVTNPTRFTVPAGMGGVWRFTGTVAFAASSSVTGRGLFFFVNGVNTIENGGARITALGSVQNSITSSVDLLLNAGDYVELAALQSTGAALAVTGKLSCEYRGTV